MSTSFWARKIREGMPKAPPAPPTAGPWWHPQAPPSDSPTNYPAVQPRPEQEAVPKPGEIIIDLRKFQSQVENIDNCPSCGSSNYFKVAGSRPRCYECGYPIRHTTSGMRATTDGTPARHARQVNIGGTYRPQDTSAGRLA